MRLGPAHSTQAKRDLEGAQQLAGPRVRSERLACGPVYSGCALRSVMGLSEPTLPDSNTLREPNLRD
jgi:hypothetical protein